jgi:hypothetical protein
LKQSKSEQAKRREGNAMKYRRTVNIDFDTRCKKIETALKRFYAKYPELEKDSREQYEYMYENGIEHEDNAPPTDRDAWTWRVWLCHDDGYFYFAWIEREPEETEPEQPETETAEADETETNEQEENTMEIRHNEYADMPYIEFCKKFHRTLKRYPGMECTYNPHYAYEVTTTKYYKVGSKWHEKTEEKTVETVPGNYYMNIIDAIPFFRNLGGSERVQMGYTLAGYIPTQLSSISPDGKEKVLRKFKPVQI